MRKIKRSVTAGSVVIGGDSPVTIQSMTNTHTSDVEATVAQIQSLAFAGCEIVRASVYDQDCVDAVKKIKPRISIPLVADIHFDHRLAIGAIEAGVDKLRFNPGNIGSELKVRELVACAREHSTPIRIGVNGGSLERELLEKYGEPNAQAMVESAMRHVHILEDENFTDIVISIKSSSVMRTIEAYRLIDAQCDYPLHIGVTEAGGNEAGLIKGALGIGTLLLDGIGDTLRVSLTGDPISEISAARTILNALEIKKSGAEVISCPTCGRTRVDLEGVVERVTRELANTKKSMRVAVMGCAVNGPGEAKQADIGIAFGKDNAVVFKRGVKVFADKLPQVVDRFIDEAKSMGE